MTFRPDEKFFISKYQPRILFCLNLLVMRITYWGPYPFLNISFGWFGTKEKTRALQFYVGIKADGTQSHVVPGEYWMVLTHSEMIALRIHGCDINPVWDDMGGA